MSITSLPLLSGQLAAQAVAAAPESAGITGKIKDAVPGRALQHATIRLPDKKMKNQ